MVSTRQLLDKVPVSETFKKIGEKPNIGKTAVAELIEDFHENGILLAMIFISLPVAAPIPSPPGVTSILGIPLIILSIQLMLGSRKIMLPNTINKYQIKNSTLKILSNKVLPILLFIEKYLKPRIKFARSVYCEQIVGLCSAIASISIMIPLPFTNAIPGFAIILMALGLLNRDGLIIIAGLVVEIMGVTLSVGVVLASLITIKYLFHVVF